MGLFQLVKQDDGIRAAADLFGQLTGLVIADIAGGEPMIFETLCFSMYSDISSRMSDSTDSNISLARRLTSSVLPTPVEPTKINETGCFLT